MEKPKAHSLYAVLGLSQHASQKTIRKAYEKLALRFDSDKSPWVVQPGPFQVKSAYDILSNPKKRAEYDKSRARARACARFYQELETTRESTCNPRERSPFSGQLRAAPRRPQLKKPGLRRTPLRAQLRVRAQLRAHAGYLAQVRQEQEQLRQEHKQALREEIREAGMGPDDDFGKIWALVSEMFELDTVNEVDEQKALVREALREEAKSREEKVAREQEAAAEAAAQARTKETEWINQEAADSILVLAGMEARPERPLAFGHAQMPQEDCVKPLVEKTNGLLGYLWDKAHSGDWLCPVLDDVDLDRLLGLVLQGDAQVSFFPPATQKLAASLLCKWHGEECDATDDGTSIVQETGSQPCSDSGSSSDSESSSNSETSEGGSSSDDSEAEEEYPGADLQLYTRAAKLQLSPFAQNETQPSPFAQKSHPPSPFAQNAQRNSTFAVSNQQHGTGTGVAFAGYKRVQPSDPYEGQEDQKSKRQKHISYV